MARLTPEQWQAIRVAWEYDADEPTYELAAARAASKYQFKAPRKQTVHERSKKDAWQRKGSLQGATVAAQRRADSMAKDPGPPQPGGMSDPVSSPADAVGASRAETPAANASPVIQALAAREDAVEKRAQVLDRHRRDWTNVAIVRNEALSIRITDPVRCSERLRQAKLAAEITAIQHAGERKAWGMEVSLQEADLEKMSDETLAAIAKGRVPKGW
jgi:hypothetical protein